MFSPRIRLNDTLYETLKKVADAKGYSSVDEFATHILEKAVEELHEELSEEEIKNRLKGLGYLE